MTKRQQAAMDRGGKTVELRILFYGRILHVTARNAGPEFSRGPDLHPCTLSLRANWIPVVSNC